MLTEALRGYLKDLGVTNAADLSVEEVVAMMDEILLRESTERPEQVAFIVTDMTGAIERNLCIISKVLSA